MINYEPILKTLNAQLSGYKALWELLKREQALLIDLDANGVAELSKEKDTLVLRLRLLEEERIRLMMRLAVALRDARVGMEAHNEPDYGRLTLNDLWKITGIEAFKELRQKLRSLLEGIDELNGINKVMIARTLNYSKGLSDMYNSLGVRCDINHKGQLLAMEV